VAPPFHRAEHSKKALRLRVAGQKAGTKNIFQKNLKKGFTYVYTYAIIKLSGSHKRIAPTKRIASQYRNTDHNKEDHPMTIALQIIKPHFDAMSNVLHSIPAPSAFVVPGGVDSSLFSSIRKPARATFDAVKAIYQYAGGLTTNVAAHKTLAEVIAYAKGYIEECFEDEANSDEDAAIEREAMQCILALLEGVSE
jgi:hypothetical protein